MGSDKLLVTCWDDTKNRSSTPFQRSWLLLALQTFTNSTAYRYNWLEYTVEARRIVRYLDWTRYQQPNIFQKSQPLTLTIEWCQPNSTNYPKNLLLSHPIIHLIITKQNIIPPNPSPTLHHDIHIFQHPRLQNHRPQHRQHRGRQRPTPILNQKIQPPSPSQKTAHPTPPDSTPSPSIAAAKALPSQISPLASATIRSSIPPVSNGFRDFSIPGSEDTRAPLGEQFNQRTIVLEVDFSGASDGLTIQEIEASLTDWTGCWVVSCLLS